MRGIPSIVMGIVFIIGGLSGWITLNGTHSGVVPAVLGVLLIASGIFWMVRR